MGLITSVVVDGRTFHSDDGPDELKTEILDAVRSGGGWVTLLTSTGHSVAVLITPLSHARIQVVPSESETAGSSGISAFEVLDFDEYGL